MENSLNSSPNHPKTKKGKKQEIVNVFIPDMAKLPQEKIDEFM